MFGWSSIFGKDLTPLQRRPLLAFGMAALIAGVVAGLERLGWIALLPTHLVALHGPLMVSGFFGTVIGLERAVAAGWRLAYLAPAASAAGVILLLSGVDPAVGAALFSAGSAVLLLTTFQLFLRQRALFMGTLVLGAGLFVVGNILWLSGTPVYRVVPWWAGFLILTIAGERLELSRFLAPRPNAKRLFMLFLVAFAVTLPFAHTNWGSLALALEILVLTAWLLRYDIARRTLREVALPRFIAVALLSGYAWLAVGALVALANGGMFMPSSYDATIHAVFLGFVFSMVFGHAPIIFPAVTRLAVPYHPAFYLHLLLLHVSLVVRLVGDLAAIPSLKTMGGVLNGVALAAFVLNTVVAIAMRIRADRAGVRVPMRPN